MARARRFVLLAEVLDSKTALAIGLVDIVVPIEQLTDQANAIARQLAQGPTLAYGEIKRLFLRAGGSQLQAQLEEEALAIARIAATQDAAEGIDALLAKRTPLFKGQ